VSFVIQPRGYADAQVQQLVAEVQAEYVIRYGGPDAARVDPSEFDPPGGLFLVGLLDGVPSVMGGWRRLSGDGRDDIAEIKRMYVVTRARRRGLSRVMLAELEASAAAAGVQRVVLNTGDQQPEAIALYESSDYVAIDGFGHYACAPGAVFYGKTLAASDAADASSGAISRE
jgi:GNAT superfamily N-acetyltransferase